jgi:hypothetical protein
VIEAIKLIEALIEHKLPSSEYLIVNSAWLAMFGIRINGDLDLIMSSRLRTERFAKVPMNNSFGLPGPLERRLRIQPQDHRYGRMFNAQGLDDVVANYGLEIEGLRFIQPRFYFEATALNVLAKREEMASASLPARWHHRWKHKHERDLRALDKFFAADQHLNSAYSMVEADQWSGPTFCKMVPHAPDVTAGIIPKPQSV